MKGVYLMKKFLNGTTMCILGVLVAVVYIMMGGGKISVDTPVTSRFYADV